MGKIEWNRPQDQAFEAGLDRGVLYIDGGPAIPWNGLISIDDAGESTTKEFYLDGIKYLAVVSPRDWKGKLSAYTYPEEFAELIGIGELGDGLYIDSQASDLFHLSYRTMVSTPGVDIKPHYKIHLIYKNVAALSEFTNQTLNGSSIDPTAFSFDLSAIPIKIPGMRPSAHVIIDSRLVGEDLLAQVEDILYGNETTNASFPAIDELIDILKFSDEVKVVYNDDGTWTATGSNKNIKILDHQGHFQIDNVAAEYLTEDIYQFFGIDTVAVITLVFDTDGVPFFQWGEGFTNIGVDTDGVPYIGLGVADASIYIDVDETPYFQFD